MSAVLKPKYRTLLQTMLDDIKHGAPGAHLEVPEVPQWVEECGGDSYEHTMSAFNKQADDKQLERFAALLDACCRDITVDQLVEMRDIIRSVRLDYSIAQAQRMIDMELMR